MCEDWYPMLHAAGYEQVFHDGLNAYLLAAEARHRAEHFELRRRRPRRTD